MLSQKGRHNDALEYLHRSLSFGVSDNTETVKVWKNSHFKIIYIIINL